MAGTIKYGPSIWLPHLIVQRGLGVKDLRNVNFRATLVQPSFGELEAWKPKEDKPNLLIQVQSIDYPSELLDNERGLFYDRGSRSPELINEKVEDGVIHQIPVRGEPVLFIFKGYSTFLFQEEYELIEEVFEKIEEISIQTTDGLSPLFQIVAVLKDK